MFENLNTALTPKLQASRSFPHLSRPAAPSSAPPGPGEPGTPGLWVGSSQHLKNLGKAMGARVNDFLRRKEPSSLGGAGVMEINKTVGAELASGVDMAAGPWLEDERPALQEAFPRLDPPPPITKKRIPRALKTTQDMLISSQPVLSNLEYGTELSPRQPQDSPPTALSPREPITDDAPLPQATSEMAEEVEALPNGEVSLSVPDLIHKDSQGEAKLRMAERERRRASSPGLMERNGLKLSLSPISLAEPLEDCSPPPRARTSSLDNEGPHPDLLSFE
ncbi:uncharacterized protein C1orf226 isoform X5 [Echinops telfairi]|nr:uncharacterized protein C1orf226 isoform X5 [Echinops telfairi]